MIGGVAKVLADEGIRLADSTLLLKPLLAGEGVLTKRKPTSDEERDIAYGRRIANALAGMDVGQSVAICDRRLRGGGGNGRHRRDAGRGRRRW